MAQIGGSDGMWLLLWCTCVSAGLLIVEDIENTFGGDSAQRIYGR